MVLALALVCIFTLGYLAQTTGLCLIRGVKESIEGKYEFLMAILLSGSLSWVAFYFANFLSSPMQAPSFAANLWFALGGVIFGIGSALNQGCGVSTLSKLSRGDVKMFATMTGWLFGWFLLALWSPNIELIKSSYDSKIINIALAVLSVVIVIWALAGNKERKKLWFSMLAIGLIASFLFLYERHWTPSSLLHHISDALIKNEQTSFPSIERYILFLSLISGMFIAAWRTKRFQYESVDIKGIAIHLSAGTFMRLGAAIALGGNDTQLLVFLPTMSLASILTMVSMLVGIRIGIAIHSYVNN
ncbi:YeeE/YedE thiosulfate transporter family protein [Thalassomonas sp. M1454]|uniref:YeeE/YedE thiosulfate transporter family protein n=1 Tax=Thalassomonas sp. M1454 TaxID=2594477 RepID=UPI001180A558|nr:YeeE/YedE thiosulfate transporter family protein [Thalassomonas sp. M1454]TRX56683.1 hypothetical protein FNN08_03915 [Thalassomonas sp. M1454]